MKYGPGPRIFTEQCMISGSAFLQHREPTEWGGIHGEGSGTHHKATEKGDAGAGRDAPFQDSSDEIQTYR